MADLIWEKKLLNDGYLKYCIHMGTDNTPLEAARMSTGNETGLDEKKDEATRDYLIRHHHDTPMEMCVLQVEIQAPIFVAREWMRHRTFGFNEYSQRYSEAIDSYYLPSLERVQGQDSINKQGSLDTLGETVKVEFINDIQTEQICQRSMYNKYIDNGVARELARINMPVSNYTRFRAQANLRNWFHFINLRSKPNAQEEIRVYSDAALELVQILFPKTTAAFLEHTFNAKTFSATEMSLLVSLVNEGISKEKLEEAKTILGNSKFREFTQKLGI